MNRTPIDAPPLTSIEEVRIRRSVHKHAFGWQQTSRLLATLDALLDERDAAVSARQEAERVLESVMSAGHHHTLGSGLTLRPCACGVHEDARAALDGTSFPEGGTVEALRAALRTIVLDISLDVPAAHNDPESFYRDGLRTAIGTAARALTAFEELRATLARTREPAGEGT